MEALTLNPLAYRMASVVKSTQSDTLLSPSYVGVDKYLLYKRSSLDDGGQVSIISMRVGGTCIEQQVDCTIQQVVVAVHELSL